MFKSEYTKSVWQDYLTGKSKLATFIYSNKNDLLDELYFVLSTLSKENVYNFYDEEFFVRDADELLQQLLNNAYFEYIVIDSSNSTKNAWNKLLRVFEDRNYLPRIVILGTHYPSSIWTRNTKYYFNYATTENVTDINDEIFKVVSWLNGVEEHSKDELLSNAENWTELHTDILLDELDKQLSGKSNFGMVLQRMNKRAINDSIHILSTNRECVSVPLLLGLSLIS